MLKRVLHLKSGQTLRLADVEAFEFRPTSFTNETLHRFLLKDNKTLIFVQGDNIAYLQSRKKRTWTQIFRSE